MATGIQVVTEKVSVGVEPNSPEGTEETIVHRGAMIPNWVDDFTQFVLTSTGMGKYVETPDPALVALASPPEPVRLPGQPPPVAQPATAPSLATPAADEGDEDAPPPVRADKSEWVDYAVAQGMGRAEAEATSKEQLVGRFGRR